MILLTGPPLTSSISDEKLFGSRESRKIYEICDPPIQWETDCGQSGVTNQTGTSHPNHRRLPMMDR
jgi:hypothetical protein